MRVTSLVFARRMRSLESLDSTRLPAHDSPAAAGGPQIDDALVPAPRPRAAATGERLDVRSVDEEFNLVEDRADGWLSDGQAAQSLVGVARVRQDVRTATRAEGADEVEQAFWLLEWFAAEDGHPVAFEGGIQ
jgi:hypothetical protein